MDKLEPQKNKKNNVFGVISVLLGVLLISLFLILNKFNDILMLNILYISGFVFLAIGSFKIATRASKILSILLPILIFLILGLGVFYYVLFFIMRNF